MNRYDRDYDAFIRYQHQENDPYSLGDNSVVRIREFSNQELWVRSGTVLNRYDQENDRFIRFSPKGQLEAGNLFTGFMRDLRGRFWLLETGNRIWRFYPDSGAIESVELFQEKTFSHKKFYMDHSGDLWIATWSHGLYQFFPDTLSLHRCGVQPDGTGVSGKFINDILEHQEGQLLIALDQGGLNIFDKQT